MLKILLKQPIHILQSLPFTAKLKISFILLTIYAYISERLYHLLPLWQIKFTIGDSQTPYIVTLLYVLLIIIFTPLIFRQLIPKEKRLSIFYTQKLSKIDLIEISSYFFFKYLFIIMLFYLPFISALLFLTPLNALYNLFIAVGATLLLFLIYFCDYARAKRRGSSPRINTLIYLSVFITANYSNYFYFRGIAPVNLIIILLGFILVKYRLRALENIELSSLFPPPKQRFGAKANRKISYSTIPRFLPPAWQIMFSKELLNLWRNPIYRITKVLSVIIYIILLFVLTLNFSQQREQLMMFVSIIAIWLHHSSHFSRKYTTEDPNWFFHTLPLKYRRVWSAKFMIEFIPVIMIITIQFLFFQFNNLSIQDTLAYCALLLIFSIAALSLKLNFQILFYDSTRLAGYAFHLSLIFMVVMSLNYRFIGPLISVILLISYFYKSYRFLKG